MNVRAKLRALALCGLGLALAGCFKNPGSPGMPTFNISIPVTPVYNYSALVDSYLHAVGSCHGNTEIVITYSSTLTSTNTVDGMCKEDKVDLNLPIQNGALSQTFHIQIVARLRTNSAPPVSEIVNYLPPAPLSPTFQITSGGGISSSASASINQTFGEVLGPATGTQAVYTAPGIEHFTGVQGVNGPN